MGQPQDPKKIASMVGIKLSEMTKALSMFSEAQTGYRLPNVFVTPLDFIPQYCESLQLNSEMTEDILRFAEGILKKEPELNEKFPQKVAAGILQYYLIIHGIQINRKEYAKIVSLSEVTINNIYKHIARIHNL
jgi:transcription initiation factor TFIIIB Brf1 subunit/transcription initiation factor TFIIB